MKSQWKITTSAVAYVVSVIRRFALNKLEVSFACQCHSDQVVPCQQHGGNKPKIVKKCRELEILFMIVSKWRGRKSQLSN